jgi:hypothetical protein
MACAYLAARGGSFASGVRLCFAPSEGRQSSGHFECEPEASDIRSFRIGDAGVCQFPDFKALNKKEIRKERKKSSIEGGDFCGFVELLTSSGRS